MTSVLKLFRSSHGFNSPYFVVDASGNIVSKSLTITGSRIELTSNSYISYNGSPLITNTALSSTITSIPGILTSLTVNGNVSVTGGNALINPYTTGTIDNVIIGSTTAKSGSFSTLTASSLGSVNLSPLGLVNINPTGPVFIKSSGTTTSINLNATASSLQLGGSRTAVSSTWAILTGTLNLQSTGLPYHSYNNPLATVPTVQNFNVTIKLKAGTNQAASTPLLVPSNTPIGYCLNGVAIFSPSGYNKSPTGTNAYYPGWEYNAAPSSGIALGYTFNDDNAGGSASLSGTYHYRDFSFITAWTTGVGYTLGSTTTTGLAEINTIPYYNGSFTQTDNHSKILGFANDGYPIYGPYGYSTATDRFSTVTRMVSGYTLNTIRVGINAPLVNSTYPLGIFVQDYTFTTAGTLDANNGRYCVTPDYPNGTYAYFVTVNSSGSPVYPYIIGPTFYGDMSASGTGFGPSTINNGSVTISPANTLTLGTVGQTTNIISNLTLTNNQNITIRPIGTGVLSVNPVTLGTIDNMNIGSTIATTGRFTNVTLTTSDENWNSNRSQVSTKRYAENMSLALTFFGMH